MCTVPQLVGAGPHEMRRAIAAALARFGEPALRFAADCDVRMIPLEASQRYRDASPALRRLGIDVDAWAIPPAGLFVVEERTAYLRSANAMTVAHEFGHGLDCALGGGVYRSGYDPDIANAYAKAPGFVTPYAATGIDEYFAECARAWVSANDPRSHWPRATRARLRAVDPAMATIVETIFARDLRRRQVSAERSNS